MKLECLDQQRRLWSVDQLLPPDLVEAIQSHDWVNAEYEPGNLMNRRQISYAGEVARFGRAIKALLPDINRQLGTNFTYIFGNWWLDLEGFWCDMHTDGHLPSAMQIYWLVPGTEYGTGFYHYKLENQLKHQFLSEPNTGYLMLNHAEPDGSQPLQWHAMLKPLSSGQIRLSSYHIIQ